MSYKLEKPYTDEQYADFVVEHNHNHERTIEETETALFALEANEILQNEKPIINPNYAEELAKRERERINALKITKREFALALQDFGITYTALKELIATNENAQLEWDLCVELERSNPLLDSMAAQTNVTPVQLDCIFKKANGETVKDTDEKI